MIGWSARSAWPVAASGTSILGGVPLGLASPVGVGGDRDRFADRRPAVWHPTGALRLQGGFATRARACPSGGTR